jgi:pilus assembly protein FimV
VISTLLATTIATASQSSSPGTHSSAPVTVTQAAAPAGNPISTHAQAPLSVTQAAGSSASGQIAQPSTAQQPAQASPSQLPVKPALSVSVQPQQAPGQNSAPGASQGAQQQPAAQPAAPAPAPAPTYPYTGNPQTDLVTIARYLVNEGGYSPAGAAGVAGCIQGESGGSPEATQGYAAGGAGLIQWTPESSIYQYGGSYGGNPQADFSNQLGAMVRYNAANGDVAALNANSDPVAAADYYSQHFERPAVIDSDVRPATAIAVYDALTGQ